MSLCDWHEHQGRDTFDIHIYSEHFRTTIMLESILGRLSKRRYEVWFTRIALTAFLWHSAIFYYLYSFSGKSAWESLILQLLLILSTAIAFDTFVFIWALFLGKGQFKNFQLLKVAVALCGVAIICIVLLVGPKFTLLNFAPPMAALYFLLSKIECHAKDEPIPD